VLGILLHFFGPAELETSELVVIALLIFALIRAPSDLSESDLGFPEWGKS